VESSSSEESIESSHEESIESSHEDSGTQLADDDIRHVAFKQITERYSYGQFGDLLIIIDMVTGEINATHLCKQGGKDFKEFIRLSGNKKLFRALSSQAGIPACDLTHQVKGGRITAIRGTYIHRDLVVPLASWISPEFALKVSRIVQSYFAKEALDAKEAEHARIVGKKDLAYTKLARKMDRQSEKMSREFAAQKAETDRVLDAIGFVQSQNVDLKHRAVGLESHLLDVKHKLRIASVDRVMPTRNEDDYPILAIVDNGSIWITSDDDSESERIPPYWYSVIRAAKGNLAMLLKRITDKYPEAVIVYRLDNPNAIVSWKYYLQKYGKNLIRKNGQFSFVDGYEEEQFWRHLKRCDQKKMKDAR